MDSILVIGDIEPNLEALFNKVGYRLFCVNDKLSAPEIMRQQIIDLVLIDSTVDKFGHEYVTFLRTQDVTRDVPIIVLSPDKLQSLQIKELNFDKIEILQAPFSWGGVVSRIATKLRLRKISGKDMDRGSLSEVNAALRDINERHQKEINEARDIQNALLPKTLPVSDLFEVAAIYQPLEEVGGDFYAIEYTQTGLLRILSADVTGHGLPAAFIGSMTKLALVAVGKESPGDLLFGMNSLLAPIMPQGRFVTANAFSFDPNSGKLQFARAGGPQALLFNAQRNKFEEVKGDGFPLGFFEEGQYPTGQLQIEKEGVFIIVTDGITEAQNRDKQFFGFEGIIKSVQKTSSKDSAQTIIDTIMNDFNAFLDGRLLKDDVTLLVLVRH